MNIAINLTERQAREWIAGLSSSLMPAVDANRHIGIIRVAMEQAAKAAAEEEKDDGKA